MERVGDAGTACRKREPLEAFQLCMSMCWLYGQHVSAARGNGR